MRHSSYWVLRDTPDGQLQDLIETAKAHICSKAEHQFRVIKQKFRIQKTWLRGFAKNCYKIHMLSALSNLIQARRTLVAIV